MELTGGLGVTKIVECSGNPDAIASTIDVIGIDGTIVLTGQSVGTKIPIEIGKTIWKNAKFAGYAGCHYYFPNTIKFVSRNIVDFTKVVTHRYSMDDALEAFELGNKGTGSGKIMIYPDTSKMPK